MNFIQEWLKRQYEIREEAQQAENKVQQDESYRLLNNLYLSIQRSDIRLTKRVYFQLQDLLHGFENHDSDMFKWWWGEFQRLPGWLNV